MAYKVITETMEDGSSITYKEYHRSKFIAFVLAMLVGGLGIHFLYARNFHLFWVHIIIVGCTLMWAPSDSFWSAAPYVFAFCTGFRYLFMDGMKFFNEVNGYTD